MTLLKEILNGIVIAIVLYGSVSLLGYLIIRAFG